MDRQQTGTTCAFATVELERPQAQHIHTEADCALSEAGACIEDETLGPFGGLILRIRRIDEIAIHVKIAYSKSDLGVFDKTMLVGQRR
ncbi:hypothetical protein D3C75_839100 [compost metagenome]